jgi:FixJ family two-component response regulator
LDLGISRRTVESHRASIMKKARVRSLPELVRLALTVAGGR